MGQVRTRDGELLARRAMSQPAPLPCPNIFPLSCSPTGRTSPPPCIAPRRPPSGFTSPKRNSCRPSISPLSADWRPRGRRRRSTILANICSGPRRSAMSSTPNIHLPMFQGGSLRGNLEGRRSEYDEAVDSYNETLLRAAQQVADSLANLKQTRSQPTPRAPGRRAARGTRLAARAGAAA